VLFDVMGSDVSTRSNGPRSGRVRPRAKPSDGRALSRGPDAGALWRPPRPRDRAATKERRLGPFGLRSLPHARLDDPKPPADDTPGRAVGSGPRALDNGPDRRDRGCRRMRRRQSADGPSAQLAGLSSARPPPRTTLSHSLSMLRSRAATPADRHLISNRTLGTSLRPRTDFAPMIRAVAFPADVVCACHHPP
jgi:hypothetical protein